MSRTRNLPPWWLALAILIATYAAFGLAIAVTCEVLIWLGRML